MRSLDWKKAPAIAAVALFAIGASWYFLGNSSDSLASGLLRANDASIVASGQQIYIETCASCHGAQLEGEDNWQSRDAEGYLPAPPHDETGHTWHHKDQLLFDLTKYGIQKFAGADYKTKMPGYEDVLSDEQIIAVLSFIKAQLPDEIRTRHDQINTATE